MNDSEHHVNESWQQLLTLEFLKITLVNVLFHLNFTAFFLLPLFIKSLGGNEADIGIIMGSSGFASVIMIPVVGSLVDRFGRKGFLCYGTAIMSIVAFMFIFITELSMPFFIFLRILQGLGFAFTFISAQTIIVDIIPDERRAEGIGMFGVFAMTTHAIGPAFAEIIHNHFGFQALFLSSVFFGACALLLSLRVKESIKTQKNFINPFVFLAENIHLSGSLLSTVICGAGFGSVLVFIPTFMKQLSITPISAFFLGYTISAILTRIFFGSLADRFPRNLIVIPSMFFYMLSIAFLSFVKDIHFLVFDGVIFGIAHGLIYPAMGALVIDICGTEKGKAMGFYSGAFNLGVTASSFVYGFVINTYGYPKMYLTSGTIMAAGLAIFILWDNSGNNKSRKLFNN